MKQLETERLLLRPFQESDLEDYYEYGSMEKVGPMAGWSPFSDRESARKRLILEMRKPFQFAIELKDEKKVIGSIVIREVKREYYGSIHIEDNSREIGCVLSEKYWGNGYMPEAIREVLKYCFYNLHVACVYACYLVKNTQIGSMDGKCGLKPVGRLINDGEWIDGTTSDLTVVSITKEEFEKTI